MEEDLFENLDKKLENKIKKFTRIIPNFEKKKRKISKTGNRKFDQIIADLNRPKQRWRKPLIENKKDIKLRKKLKKQLNISRERKIEKLKAEFVNKTTLSAYKPFKHKQTSLKQHYRERKPQKKISKNPKNFFSKKKY